MVMVRVPEERSRCAIPSSSTKPGSKVLLTSATRGLKQHAQYKSITSVRFSHSILCLKCAQLCPEVALCVAVIHFIPQKF